MANNFSYNPIVVDTTFSSGPGTGGTILVYKVYWYNPTAAADTFTITDASTGATLLTGYAQTANQSQMFEFGMVRLAIPLGGSGWSVTISSGTLYLYHE